MGFITQAKSERNVVCHAPGILRISSNDVGGLCPAAATEAAAKCSGQAKEEIGHSFTRVLQGIRRGRRSEVGAEGHSTQFTAVPRVEHFDDVAHILTAKLESVTAMGPGDGIISLPYLAVKALCDHAVTDVGESTSAWTGRRSSAEIKA